jgi:Transposase
LSDHSYGMRQHKEEDLARWRGLVSEQVASGTTVAAFCRDRGLRDWQLYEWKKRLRATEITPFIVVEVASAEVASAGPEKMSGIEMRHRGGWSVIVEPAKRCKSPASFGGSGDRERYANPILEMAVCWINLAIWDSTRKKMAVDGWS